MREAKRQLRRSRVKRRTAAALSAPSDRILIVNLLKEMHQLILDAGTEIGVASEDAMQAIALASQDPRRGRPSETIMNVNYRIAMLLNHWRNDSRYQRPEGTPKVLAIRGRGTSLQSLARTFVPALKLKDLVALICENAEVTRLKGGKIALVGSPVMMTPKTPEFTLASLALRLRRLTGTVLHNASFPAKVKSTGRFERIVTGELTEREFRDFALSVRQPMQDLCDRIDAGIRQPQPSRRSRAKERPCGVGLYVFRDDGEIG